MREANARAIGLPLEKVFMTDDLVHDDDVGVALTGVTHGELVNGVRYVARGARTETLVMRSRSGTWSGSGYQGRIATPATATWAIEPVPAGQVLRQPEPLFVKLDPKIAEEELARLQAAALVK